LTSGRRSSFRPRSPPGAWLFCLILRTHGLAGRPALALLIVLALAALTGLPWYVAQLMPDAWAGSAVLALYLLAFRAVALRRLERLALVLIIAAAIAAHMAILALGLGLLAWFAVVRLLPARLDVLRPRLAAPAGAVAAGVGLCLASNLVIAGQFAFTPGGVTFVFGRLIQDGVVARYLDERCPDSTVKLCAYRAKLPVGTDDWIWGNDSPLHKLGGWQGYAPEERLIILETLRLYPGRHLAAALASTAKQTVTFRTAISVSRWDNADVIATFERLLPPPSLARFRQSRQMRAPWDVDWLNIIHVPVGFLGMGLLFLPAALGRNRRLHPYAAPLCWTVLAALAINAAVCGAFSNPADRYQSRMIPLALLSAAVAALGSRRDPNSSEAFSDLSEGRRTRAPTLAGTVADARRDSA
jgi:hypothetical protein